jgi:hypothetical protein
LAALACALVVTLVAPVGERLKSYSAMPFGLLRYRVSLGTSAMTLGLWTFAAVMCVMSYPGAR